MRGCCCRGQRAASESIKFHTITSRRYMLWKSWGRTVGVAINRCHDESGSGARRPRGSLLCPCPRWGMGDQASDSEIRSGTRGNGVIYRYLSGSQRSGVMYRWVPTKRRYLLIYRHATRGSPRGAFPLGLPEPRWPMIRRSEEPRGGQFHRAQGERRSEDGVIEQCSQCAIAS